MCSRTLPPKVKRFTLREEGTAKRGLPLFTSLISRNINIMWVFATGKENFYRQVMTGGMHLTFASSELTLNTITLAKSLVVKTTHFNLTM